MGSCILCFFWSFIQCFAPVVPSTNCLAGLKKIKPYLSPISVQTNPKRNMVLFLELPLHTAQANLGKLCSAIYSGYNCDQKLLLFSACLWFISVFFYRFCGHHGQVLCPKQCPLLLYNHNQIQVLIVTDSSITSDIIPYMIIPYQHD